MVSWKSLFSPERKAAIEILATFIFHWVFVFSGGSASILLGFSIYNMVTVSLERYFPSTIYFLAILLTSTLCATYLAKEMRKHEVEEETLSISFGRNLELLLTPAIVIDVVAFGAQALSTYFNLFPEQVAGSLRIEILKTVTQANGFLIGLTGIVFAQMLWAINNQQCSIQIEMIKQEGKESQVGYTNVPPSDAPVDYRQRYVDALERKRRNVALWIFLVLGSFVFSIALSLSEMARTGAYGADLSVLTPTKPDIVNPVLSMIFGILLFAFSIATSRLSLKKEKQTIKQ